MNKICWQQPYPIIRIRLYLNSSSDAIASDVLAAVCRSALSVFKLECCAVDDEGWVLWQESEWFHMQVWNPGTPTTRSWRHDDVTTAKPINN